MGFRRVFKYLWFRLVRINSDPSSVALAVAIGVAVSFTPFLGFHVILAVALAVILRVNVTACLIGTIVGNPLTLPIFIVLELRTGLWLADLFLPTHLYLASSDFEFSTFIESPSLLFDNSQVYIVAVLGCLPWVFLSGALSYGLTRYFLVLWKARRTKRLLLRTRHKLSHGAENLIHSTAYRLKRAKRKTQVRMHARKKKEIPVGVPNHRA